MYALDDPAVPDDLASSGEANPHDRCARCGHARADHRVELLRVSSAPLQPYCEHDDHDDPCDCPSWQEPDREDA